MYFYIFQKLETYSNSGLRGLISADSLFCWPPNRHSTDYGGNALWSLSRRHRSHEGEVKPSIFYEEATAQCDRQKIQLYSCWERVDVINLKSGGNPINSIKHLISMSCVSLTLIRPGCILWVKSGYIFCNPSFEVWRNLLRKIPKQKFICQTKASDSG